MEFCPDSSSQSVIIHSFYSSARFPSSPPTRSATEKSMAVPSPRTVSMLFLVSRRTPPSGFSWSSKCAPPRPRPSGPNSWIRAFPCSKRPSRSYRNSCRKVSQASICFPVLESLIELLACLSKPIDYFRGGTVRLAHDEGSHVRHLQRRTLQLHAPKHPQLRARCVLGPYRPGGYVRHCCLSFDSSRRRGLGERYVCSFL